METKIEKLNDLVKIQCSPGNYDQNEYMRGMANGLLVAQSIFSEKEPVFFDPPPKI